MSRTTYASDIQFLKEHTNIIELSGSDDAKVAIAPDFQGRVMTATLGGDSGASYGWVNRPFIAKGEESDKFNNYGGADRFWLGPEAGQYALFFKDGAEFDADNWVCPPEFTSGPFKVTASDDTSVELATTFAVTNYAGRQFDCDVKRTINLVARTATTDDLGITIDDSVKTVAYESINTLTNAGSDDWGKNREKGMLCLWTLGMMKGLENGRVIIPFIPGDESQLGPKVIGDYFGQVSADRLKVAEDFCSFRCDAKEAGKIGIRSRRAKNVFGCYDIANKQLTIVKFNLPADAAERQYVNPAWAHQENPFEGDGPNSYNDMGTDDGEATFFELESSSPVCDLKPGDSMTHTHRTCHFEGTFEALNAISTDVLGIDLNDI